jgi:hypothetical protein
VVSLRARRLAPGGGRQRRHRVPGRLDPPYRRLRELAAARQAEEAGGGVRWLNLPLPGDSVPVANHSGKGGWSADFVPLGDDPREWTQLIGVQGLPRSKQPGQALRLLEGMQDVRARRCGVPAGPVEALLPEASASAPWPRPSSSAPRCRAPTTPSWPW